VADVLGRHDRGLADRFDARTFVQVVLNAVELPDELVGGEPATNGLFPLTTMLMYACAVASVVLGLLLLRVLHRPSCSRIRSSPASLYGPPYNPPTEN
jgi:hypothetical protein